MAKFNNDIVSPSTPRTGNAFTRWLGDAILKLLGWKIVGKLPDHKKLIVVGAPHTSNWDFIVIMAAMLAVGLKFSWMMKKEAFFWPLGPLWKAMGGVPVDRSANNNVADQMVEWFNAHENVWLGITPEGTRSHVTRFKKGYLLMANAANVPIFIAGLNGPKKEIVLDKVWELTGPTINDDNKAIKAYYDENFIGIKP